MIFSKFTILIVSFRKVINMKKKKLTKKELCWILYDVGNSAFTMVSVSLFALFFTNLTNLANISSVDSDAFWSYAASIVL